MYTSTGVSPGTGPIESVPRFHEAPMATEIERKYLVLNDSWRARVRQEVRYLQGYLANTRDCSVRVRVGGDSAFPNVKGGNIGASPLRFHKSPQCFCTHLSGSPQFLDQCLERQAHYQRNPLLNREHR